MSRGERVCEVKGADIAKRPSIKPVEHWEQIEFGQHHAHSLMLKYPRFRPCVKKFGLASLMSEDVEPTAL